MTDPVMPVIESQKAEEPVSANLDGGNLNEPLLATQESTQIESSEQETSIAQSAEEAKPTANEENDNEDLAE